MTFLLLLAAPAVLAKENTAPLVWPKPVSATAGSSDHPISFSNFSFIVPDEHGDDLLAKAAGRYTAIIAADGAAVAPHQAQVPYPITVTVADMTVPLSPGPEMNESYTLEVKTAGCALAAPTVWGALRGMETLAQLVKRGSDGGYELSEVSISDQPRFGWVRRSPLISFPPDCLTPTHI